MPHRKYFLKHSVWLILLSLQRWRDLFLYTCIAAVFLAYAKTWDEQYQAISIFISVLLVFYYVYINFDIEYLRNLNQRWQWLRLLAHPPLYVSILIFFCLPYAIAFFKATYIHAWLFWESTNLPAWGGLLLAGGTVLFFLTRRWNVSRPLRPRFTPLPMTVPHIDITNWDNEKIKQWITNETPVEQAETLLFSRHLYVARLYQLITSHSEEGRRLALVGELGSGKTSVINCLVHSLKQQHEREWIFVTIDCWGRSPDSIDSQVLSLIIDELRKHTDISGYRSIDSAFHSALQDVTGWLGTMTQFLSNSGSDAIALLRRIDRLLSLLGKRMLLIIEDADRTDWEGEQRCERLASMMDRLRARDTPNISFIFSVARARESLIRVCEYREDLSDESNHYVAVLNAIADSLWYNDPHIIYPNPKQTFTQPDIPLKTIREFKNTLRTVNALWGDRVNPGPLQGEIDLQELVMLALAKEYNSDLIGQLKNQISDRTQGFYDWCTHNRDFALTHAFQDIGEKKREQPAGVPGTFLRFALKRSRQFQVCASNGRVDYLARFLRRGLLPGEERDQSILRQFKTLSNKLRVGGTPDLNLVACLVQSGNLSPWFYAQLEGLENVSDALQSLGTSILTVLEKACVAHDGVDHPATQHLFEVVSRLTRLGNQSGALKIIELSLQAPTTAGLALLTEVRETPLMLLPAEEKWKYYECALNNSAFHGCVGWGNLIEIFDEIQDGHNKLRIHRPKVVGYLEAAVTQDVWVGPNTLTAIKRLRDLIDGIFNNQFPAVSEASQWHAQIDLIEKQLNESMQPISNGES